jgi:hypothetical protein
MKISIRQKIDWYKNGVKHKFGWFSEAGLPLPTELIEADDNSSANQLFKAAKEGTAILWQGDYPNARNMLTALTRRVNRQQTNKASKTLTPQEIFIPTDKPKKSVQRFWRNL